MGDIRILSEQLRNQIAAGEVVERPASVAKELLENSLDADAKRIVLEIAVGGTELIRVTDDGNGMDKEDAELALERHATSKIEVEEDLHRIRTRGFRGEALASIASVSQFCLKTKRRGEVEGYELVCDGGEIKKFEVVGCPEGTQVEVKNLFFNTPARKKYLKTTATEYQQILAIVTQLALVNPGVSFSLIKDGRQIFDVPATAELSERIQALLGRSVGEALIPVFFGGADIQLEGFVGHPRISRKSRKGQYLFVNGRPVQNSAMSYMVKDAFGSLLMDGKQPFFVICLEISPELVDVNVHPRKTEVRFVDQREVNRVVRRACLAALDTNLLRPQIAKGMSEDEILPQGVTGEQEAMTLSTHDFGPTKRSLMGDVDPVTGVIGEANGGAVDRNRSTFHPSGEKTNAVAQISSTPLHQGFEGQVERQPPSPASNAVAPNPSTIDVSQNIQADQSIGRPHARLEDNLSMKPIVQVANSYIVAQNADGLVLIDQHAAHERVLFAKFEEAWEKRPLASQPMLMPLNIELSHQEISVLEENIEVFQKLGFEIEAFGGNTFALGAIPADARKVNVEKLIMGILDDLTNERKPKTAEERKIKILEYMACRTAIKFGDPLTHEEMVGLIKEMDKTEGIVTCPHGRPTMLPLTFGDLEKMFGRRG